mmetsp:Transcript_32254/g.81451  ORF Transcript_32254/g.81451 Transcript_32254/m.81451 type:complete len:206 (-) Transcript_32254:1337-1954(-)
MLPAQAEPALPQPVLLLPVRLPCPHLPALRQWPVPMTWWARWKRKLPAWPLLRPQVPQPCSQLVVLPAHLATPPPAPPPWPSPSQPSPRPSPPEPLRTSFSFSPHLPPGASRRPCAPALPERARRPAYLPPRPLPQSMPTPAAWLREDHGPAPPRPHSPLLRPPRWCFSGAPLPRLPPQTLPCHRSPPPPLQLLPPSGFCPGTGA